MLPSVTKGDKHAYSVLLRRGGTEAIIYKILERGGPKSLKMALEYSFQSFPYKSFVNFPQMGGGGAGLLCPSPKSATEQFHVGTRFVPKIDFSFRKWRHRVYLGRRL